MYIPKILLCGDKEKFLQKIGDRQVEILGQISFKGAAERGEFMIAANINELKKVPLKAEDFKIFIDGAEISFDTLRKILNDAADYIVFENDHEIAARLNEFSQLDLLEQIITTKSLLKYARDNFYSIANVEILIKSLRKLKISRALDIDNFLANNDLFYTWLNPDLEIETVDGDSFAKKYPVVENLYRGIYSSLDECRLKNYDAIILTAERTPDEFLEVLTATDSMTENILVFIGKNSALSLWLKKYEFAFEKIETFFGVSGNWVFLKKLSEHKDFCMYVVTHKDVKLDALPEGYKIIHAGHATAKKDFGYLGDDTGSNISTLNRYLNEITAIYWIWQNTNHKIIGLCHYRRFFTAQGNWNPYSVRQNPLAFSVEKILTESEAIEILRGCDMIIVKGNFFALTQTNLKSIVCENALNHYVEKIFRKYIALKQPDYLKAFDYVSSSYSEYLYEMFITRRNVFNAYCKWLFSFIIHVTKEVLTTTNLEDINNPRKYRSIGLISERLMTVWLMKNRLRLKTLPIMFRDNI